MSKAASPIQFLTEHLQNAAAVRTRDAGGYFPIAHLATEILADPQAHIDALVKAGVLENCTARWSESDGIYEGPAYRVVQPHKHEWAITTVDFRRGNAPIHLGCINAPCDAERWVSYRIPIEVPS